MIQIGQRRAEERKIEPMDTPSWFLGELEHAGEEHRDPEYVATYDRKAGTDPSDDLALLQDLGLNRTHTIVDLGAGTGTFTLAAAPLCRRMVAVDVSSAMIAHLRGNTNLPGYENVECVQAGFLTYEHQGEPADFVYSRHALHHLPDFWKALALTRIAATLKLGGVLLLRDIVFSFNPNEAEYFIETWLTGAAGQPERGWTRRELEVHMREEYSTFSWLLEAMIARAGFEIREASSRGSNIYAAYTCIKV